MPLDTFPNICGKPKHSTTFPTYHIRIASWSSLEVVQIGGRVCCGTQGSTGLARLGLRSPPLRRRTSTRPIARRGARPRSVPCNYTRTRAGTSCEGREVGGRGVGRGRWGAVPSGPRGGGGGRCGGVGGKRAVGGEGGA